MTRADQKHEKMKNILIATDLTPAARSASEYGMELAEAFNARVVLASAFEQVNRLYCQQSDRPAGNEAASADGAGEMAAAK